MKFTVHRLRVGDVVRAQVVEIVQTEECIVSFNGDLIRVRNESSRHLKPNEKILVRVVQLNPLSFQVLSAQESTKPNRINLNV